MLIVGKNKDELSLLKKNLSQTFDVKDLGDARHIFRIRITRDRSKRCIYLSQVKYISKMLKRFNMENAKALSSPLPTYVKLSTYDCPTSDEDKEFMSKVPYQSTVGSLMYELILRYLSGTKDKCLCLGRGDASIIGYTDLVYARCADSRKSIYRYIFQIMGGAIAWRSGLQECVALSTTKAVYVAASGACTKAV
jgi:ATP-binding cassette subfamily B (MDR/TAP) protein 1